jgi:hypothetical protein
VGIDNLEDYRDWVVTRNDWLDAHPAKSEYQYYRVEATELK